MNGWWTFFCDTVILLEESRTQQKQALIYIYSNAVDCPVLYFLIRGKYVYAAER